MFTSCAVALLCKCWNIWSSAAERAKHTPVLFGVSSQNPALKVAKVYGELSHFIVSFCGVHLNSSRSIKRCRCAFAHCCLSRFGVFFFCHDIILAGVENEAFRSTLLRVMIVQFLNFPPHIYSPCRQSTRNRLVSLGGKVACISQETCAQRWLD